MPPKLKFHQKITHPSSRSVHVQCTSITSFAGIWQALEGFMVNGVLGGSWVEITKGRSRLGIRIPYIQLWSSLNGDMYMPIACEVNLQPSCQNHPASTDGVRTILHIRTL